VGDHGRPDVGLEVLETAPGAAAAAVGALELEHDPSNYIHDWWNFPKFGIAGAAISVCLVGIVVFVILPIAKILSDIVLYVGDNKHREIIHSQLDQTIRSLPLGDRSRLVVIGHSLGSVIAVDSLLRFGKRWPHSAQIVLVTMGSPLKRFFTVFFQSFYTIPNIFADSLLPDTNVVRWVNVYRPWDPIGTSLFTIPHKQITEICTNQWFKVIHAHLGYWSDRKVMTIMHDSIAGHIGHADVEVILSLEMR